MELATMLIAFGVAVVLMGIFAFLYNRYFYYVGKREDEIEEDPKEEKTVAQEAADKIDELIENTMQAYSIIFTLRSIRDRQASKMQSEKDREKTNEFILTLRDIQDGLLSLYLKSRGALLQEDKGMDPKLEYLDRLLELNRKFITLQYTLVSFKDDLVGRLGDAMTLNERIFFTNYSPFISKL